MAVEHAPHATQRAALDSGRSAAEARALREIASAGLKGAGSPYPHRERIERAFGAYAPTGLRAYIGPTTAAAADALHATGFVMGGRAGFGRAPDLRTAAHEAAHAVDQAYGREPAGGVGAPGDRGERFAHAVADAVARGGSAEPLFTEALGPAAAEPPPPADGGALQMDNAITSPAAPAVATPWKEIEDQLGLDKTTFDIRNAVKAANTGRFGPMVANLGDSCLRANSVTAEMDGQRNGGPRKADPMQTAYGALGTFMEFITGTNEVSGYEFEGGHLISDKILGDDSYVQSNFAPQRGHLNSPIYRNIEKIAEKGPEPKDSSVTKTMPNWTLTANVTYDAGSIDVKTTDIMSKLNIKPTDIKKTPTPATVSLSQRVPKRWTAVADTTDTDFVFKFQSKVDPALKSGAALGFRNSEADVLNEEAHTTTHLDATFWSMDSLDKAVNGASATTRGTGVGPDRRSRHTFTAVQSVPLGQSLTLNKATNASPPKAATPLPLAKAGSFSDFGASSGLTESVKRQKKRGLSVTKTQEQQKKENTDRRKKTTAEFLKNNPTVTSELAMLRVTEIFERAKYEHSLGHPVDLSRLLYLANQTTGPVKDLVVQITYSLGSQITNTSGTGPF